MPTTLELPQTLRSAPPFSGSEYCWVPDLPPSRNQFVSFERGIFLAEPESATIHLFADSRFRLFVNERFVAYGPGRFVTAHPEYDTYELGGLLVAGENLIRVEVNYYGCPSFQTMPDGRPGFIADGGTPDGRISFATPGEWRARVHHAWSADAPHFSFAQNPAEICDTRVLEAELALADTVAPAALSPATAPWNQPVARTVPNFDYAPVRPERLLAAGPLAPALRWGVQLHHPDFQPEKKKFHPRYASFLTWIHSPKAQVVTMDCFWSKMELDGRWLEIEYSRRLGNHGETTVELRAGWNLLAGSTQLLLTYWSLMLGFPPDSGLSLHARPDLACGPAFALSPVLDLGIVPPAQTPEAFTLPAGWREESGDITRVTPARLVGWDQPIADQSQYDIPFAPRSSFPAITAEGALWNFGFASEYYGHPVVEVEAPAGAILDLAYDDWRRGDGCVNLYNSNPFTDAVDRFILKGGRQRIEVLNPRGGIFLQALLRVPAGSEAGTLRIHSIAVCRRTTLNTCDGHFACGDETLEWTWQAAALTLQASTDEAYADCPWRERGSYVGDSLVNLHIHRLISTDLSVAQRTITLFGRTQTPDGQIACCAPSWLTRPHGDFTLLWILAVRDFWAISGDAAFARAQLPMVRRALASGDWNPDENGLWGGPSLHIFIDWGATLSERGGPANTVLNILRFAALQAAAELAQAIGADGEARTFQQEAARVETLIMRRLWNNEEGRFLARISDPAEPAVHANIMALRYGVGPADRILAHLEPALRENLDKALAAETLGGFVELYFFHYLLPALAAHGRHDLAESLIDQTYGYVKSLGHATLPECFHRAKDGRGSCCHSWSGAPAVYATAYILGLRQAGPGRTDEFILDPAGSRHASAEGVLPHVRGPIQVSWERHGERVRALVHLPEGITLTGAAHVDIVFA